MYKWLAFDIETARPAPDDPAGSHALGVTCAATLIEGDDEPLLWHGEIGPDGRYAETMTPGEVQELAAFLVGAACEGYRVAGINSLGFDLRVLAEESQDVITFDNLRDLALAHYDPPFQMLAERGFMVGMKALGIGLELQEQKTAEMDGVKAVEMWTEGDFKEQQKVLEYVAQDARTTLAIVQAIEAGGAVVWKTSRGSVSRHRLYNGLLTVRECLALPLPDTSWMTDPWPREKFAGWLE